MIKTTVAGALLVSAVADKVYYCPSQKDFDGNGKWNGSGWKMTGPGGMHGRQTYNLLGGYIEFDIDTTHAHTGVNNNLYLISPEKTDFDANVYCDIQGVNKPSCMEMDLIENNGNCVGQTTWHTWPNWKGDCDRGGCGGTKYRKGKTHIKATFAENGWMTVTYDGVEVTMNRHPSDNARKYVQETMGRLGAQIWSSQWVGWVPSGNCGASGDLESSTFGISNLKVYGTILQGPEPSKCQDAIPLVSLNETFLL
eukprot:TRINITY_DN123294_c0_g1_i1.p1 TRINITY_DN123294_c0_g1~~TRINITY_DN123294_c0_g1_i1.p1  ORF type:complete len:253 (+),score=47.91 TRINITY_DN123294_c0_g1_i1:67-825(+)